MPKENNSKRIQFFLNLNVTKDQTLYIWLKDQSKGNISNLLKDILLKVKNGEHEDLRDKKTLVEIRLKETQIKLNEKRLLYYNTFENNPTPQAQRAMKIGITNENQTENYVSCYDEKNDRFQCPDCGILFNYSKDHKDISESKMQFADHYFQKHGSLSERLVKEMSEIK
jgi:hypothetical protein